MNVPTQNELLLALGLMSGTSADGIDVAVLRTDGRRYLEQLGGTSVAYEEAFQSRLIRLASSRMPLAEARVQAESLEHELTLRHCHAVQRCCEQLGLDTRQLDVIGFHGQTVRHNPAKQMTWQLGDGRLLARKMQCRVVDNFRQADIDAGGEGAPLAPLYHQALVSNRPLPQLLINIGGVANVTWVGEADLLLAGDTGPGCGLLDALTRERLGSPMDRDGALANAGHCDESYIARVFDEIPFFARPIPKSADRYEFEAIDVSHLSHADAAATLCAITVEAICRIVDQLPIRPKECWVAGGGSRHPSIMQGLMQRLPRVQSISATGSDADLLEAECFAWLGVRRLLGLPTSLPSTTGASQPVCGGRLSEV